MNRCRNVPDGATRVPTVWLATWMLANASEPNLRGWGGSGSLLDEAPRVVKDRGPAVRSSTPPMMDATPSSDDVTILLRRWADGDERALDRLVPLVYDELRGVAHRRLRSERTGHTLRTTALVHEAYARLAGADLSLNDRAHFFALAARTMRRILVDYVRARQAEKRGGDAEIVSFDDVTVEVPDTESGAEILELHAALDKLEAQDARKAKVVEAHIFGGLTYEETGRALGISPATVDRDLRLAKAWLARELA